MLIHEVCKGINLTKKAIEYYTQKGFVAPEVLSNGYRDYKEEDVEILRKIGMLRKLDLSMEDIKEVLKDSTDMALERVIARKELKAKQDAKKDAILRDLVGGKSYSELEEELQALEMEEAIGKRLLDAFPGYYGRFVCMHFSRFLKEPVKTEEQQSAYETILSFLDQMPLLQVPGDMEKEMSESLKDIGLEQIEDMLENVKQSIERPEDFLEKNQETIEWYLSYRASGEYQASAAGKWMEYMRVFQNTSGYTEIFLPAMKRLSPSYGEYCLQMEQANKRLLERYPEIERLSFSHPEHISKSC